MEEGPPIVEKGPPIEGEGLPIEKDEPMEDIEAAPTPTKTDESKTTSTHDRNGNTKLLGYKKHLERMLKEKPDTLTPGLGGIEEFEERVESGRIKKGYIIFVAREFRDSSVGKKLHAGCLGPIGILASSVVEKNVDQKYIFAHVAIYVGKWEGIHYLVENGGRGTGKELLSGEDAKKYDSAIRLIEARKVIGYDQPFLAVTIPFGQVGEYHDGYKMRKRKIWPLQEELTQKALASVGFPFNYNLRSMSCETFVMVLIGMGENDDKDVFPQLEILLENTTWLGKRYIGSSEITEEDRQKVEEFRDRFRRYAYYRDINDRIDTSAFKVKGGAIVIEEQVIELDKPAPGLNANENGNLQ